MAKMEELAKWQRRILFASWITYASFYLLRANFAIAIPGIMEEFGISKTALGGVATALFTAYAIGQFVNGQLGDKFSAKKLVGMGLLFSAILNLIFGFTNGFLTGMIVIWGLNGFFQAMGWAPTVKIVASWFPVKQRGKASGILGTSYQIGSAASWALSGVVVGLLGWRWAFWVPIGITVLSAINWILSVRDKAEDEGFQSVEIAQKATGLQDTIKSTLANKRVWIVALGLFGLNIVHYGFLIWAPTYLFEVQGVAISIAAYKALIIPLAGSLGALSAGWLSDKVFGNRRAPMAVIMLVILALAVWGFPQIPVSNWILGLIVLAIIGFMTFGPHAMMVTALPMDLGTKEKAASATGFIDGWGHIGAALTGVGTGYLLDNFGWDAVFYFWIAGCVIAVMLMATLWNFRRIE